MASMDLDAPVQIGPINPRDNVATILCCNCGAPIPGTQSTNALCESCIRLTVDISEGIPRESAVHFCRDCDRYLLPPATWVSAAPESRELLALCLKKLRGVNKVRVVDASFVWTEPHSRRIRVRITVQDSVGEGVLLQQSFEVVYAVAYQQCADCLKSYSAHVWRACVQVRQKVAHKRSLLALEQYILKHGAHKDTLNIKEAKDGIDFFFSTRNQAEKFVDFLNGTMPIKVKKSQELISEDIQNSTKSFKFTFSVEIVPVCRDDLVALPIKLARQVGNISPLVLCHRVGTSVSLVDPSTLQTADISGSIYWRTPFLSLADARELVEFVVLDIDPTPVQQGKWILAEATVARASDLGANDKSYWTRTHLGRSLKPGDSAMGYMLTGSNFNSDEFDAIEGAGSGVSADVVLVKKHYPRRRRHRQRGWKLRRMAKDQGDLAPKKGDQERIDEEYEMFLRDIEEDEELRATLALYKNSKPRMPRGGGGAGAGAGAGAGDAGDAMSVVGTEDGEDDDLPPINVDGLLEDLDELTIEDSMA